MIYFDRVEVVNILDHEHGTLLILHLDILCILIEK